MNNSVLLSGDLSKLSSEERIQYYNDVCNSVGLNPLTKPLEYITLNSKLTLYAKRDATEQLRKIHQVSITRVFNQTVNDVFIVTAEAADRTGRTDSSTGAVAIGGLKGDNLANALMKAETKAKRRVTLSICGLGMLDETELETIKDAKTATFTPEVVKEIQLMEKVLDETKPSLVEHLTDVVTKRRGRKPKEQLFPPIENHSAEITNADPIVITDADLPDFDSPEPKPDYKFEDRSRMPNTEEKKAFAERARSFSDRAGVEELRAFILKHAGVAEPRDLTVAQWESALAQLDATNGDQAKLQELVKGTIEVG